MTTIRSASTTVDSRCAMTSTVVSGPIAATASASACSLRASRLDVGSSSSSRAGRASRARAMARRCRCPPDSRMPSSPTWVSRPRSPRSSRSLRLTWASTARSSSSSARGPAEQQVVADGPGQGGRVLLDVGGGRAQLAPVEVAHVVPADEHRAGVGVVEPLDQGEHGRLAGPGRADQRGPPAGGRGERRARRAPARPGRPRSPGPGRRTRRPPAAPRPARGRARRAPATTSAPASSGRASTSSMRASAPSPVWMAAKAAMPWASGWTSRNSSRTKATRSPTVTCPAATRTPPTPRTARNAPCTAIEATGPRTACSRARRSPAV